jgi:hypothetical protein
MPALLRCGSLPSTGLALLLRLDQESQRYHYNGDNQKAL